MFEINFHVTWIEWFTIGLLCICFPFHLLFVDSIKKMNIALGRAVWAENQTAFTKQLFFVLAFSTAIGIMLKKQPDEHSIRTMLLFLGIFYSGISMVNVTIEFVRVRKQKVVNVKEE